MGLLHVLNIFTFRSCLRRMSIIFTFSLVLFVCWANAALADYNAPSDCQWTTYRHHLMEPTIHLTCHVDAVGAGKSNFSLIQSVHTVGLTIICDDRYSESRLTSSSLAHLRHLKSLKFQKCSFSEIPDESFAGLNSLKNLTINTGKVFDGKSTLVLGVKALSKVRELERLDLANNNILALPEYPFCGLISLKYLNLRGNALQDLRLLGLEERKLFPCVPELQVLDLSKNRVKQLTDEVFSSLRRLRNLSLSDNQLSMLSPYSLIGLQRLRVIDLSNNKLSEFHPHFFHHSTELREIYLRNNSVAGFPSALFRSLPALTILDLSHNDISDLRFLSDSFKSPNKLVVLNISHNKVRRIEGVPFQSLTNLQILLLDNNIIEYISESTFAHLSELKALFLRHNKLRFIEASTFDGLNAMRELYLSNNDIELLHSDAFANCTYLRSLDLGNNSLAAFPVAVNRLEYLRHL